MSSGSPSSLFKLSMSCLRPGWIKWFSINLNLVITFFFSDNKRQLIISLSRVFSRTTCDSNPVIGCCGGAFWIFRDPSMCRTFLISFKSLMFHLLNLRVLNVMHVLKPRQHYTRGIWKRNNRRSFCICIWGKLGQENHMVIVKPLCLKCSVFKMLSVHTKTQSRHFQLPPVCRAFSKSSVFVTD